MSPEAPVPFEPYTPAEPLVCPLCGSHDIDTTVRDSPPLTVATILNPPHPLTYGLIATCRVCELAWKPAPQPTPATAD